MKQFKYVFAGFIIVAIVLFAQNVSAQKPSKSDAKKAAIENNINSQHFTFQAQSATPLGRNIKILTTVYTVSISKDSLVSYLPYFGTAYNAPINENKSPLDFTSTNFTYSKTAARRKSWNIMIKIKNKTEELQYAFTIFDNGTASLTVNSTSRQTITFNGVVKS